MRKAHHRNRMRVSFDLDEVLFVNPETHKTEPPLHFPFNILYKERLRKGTPDLIRELQHRDIDVWIYTSSFRTEKYIYSLFRHYGVRLENIVNGQRHQAEVQRNHPNPMPTKLPNIYKIALHVDDEDIVCTYGKIYGFEVYKLDKQQDNWCENILERVEQIRRKKYPESAPKPRNEKPRKAH